MKSTKEKEEIIKEIINILRFCHLPTRQAVKYQLKRLGDLED